MENEILDSEVWEFSYGFHYVLRTLKTDEEDRTLLFLIFFSHLTTCRENEGK